MNEIKIGTHLIGPNHPPFIVAEISANHNQSVDRALALVKAAKEAGAHAIKLQTYTPDTITLNIDSGPFMISDKTSPWYGRSLYNLYQEAYTPWEWHKPIFDLCKELDMVGFSTPFDDTAIDFLESLNVPCYKIASLEIIDLPLIKKAAKTKKPLIISTGASTLIEIEEAVETANQAGAKEIILLKCTSAYPAPFASMNLRTIADMKEKFQTVVGLSDHSRGISVPLVSIAFGASLIEKHFTLSRQDGGVDAPFSIEPDELKLLIEESKNGWLSLGKVIYEPIPEERASLALRRSLFFVKDLKKGEKITDQDIRSIRPAGGLPPKEYGRVIRRTVNRDVKRGDPVTPEVLE